jgi:acyl-CoA thioester hydrolase
MKGISHLKSVKEIEVRFNELDPLDVVWHGNYIKYFEDGREDFGEKHGIGYRDVRKAGLITPIVSVNCKFKKFVRFGDKLKIETCYIKNPAAKIVLTYCIRRLSDNEVVAEGSTEQVFTDQEGNLMLCTPPFFSEWKLKWGLEDN